ncbi:hypothetical protein CUMW_212890 [Citrus unshiu]|uniref:Uncharacterized protein n=1 Tax=Citrus unshiu TaxID=55188 RepID=A0A2H5QAY6_CITUN|nr:hypothetical protein CUMW_212890 [Citrus unshiu]
MYNSYEVLVGKKRNDLRNYIGVIVQERVLIIYDDWRKVPLDIKEMLWTHFQETFKLSLKAKTQEKSKAAKEKRANNMYNHHLGSAGYDGMLHKRSELRSQVEQGTFQSQGPNDILGEALQKKPNGSRVQGLGQFIIPSMYFNVPDPMELAREQRMYQESFQFMQAQLDQMNARINACNNTEVGSSNFPNSKGGCSVKMEIDRR